MKCKIPAIVFGGGINGLAVIRNLGRHGITTYNVVEEKDEVGYSRYCKKVYAVSKIQESVDILKSFLDKLGKSLENYAVLFPTNDAYSLNLSLLKEELEGNYYVPLPSYEIVKTLVDKKEFYQSLSKHLVPHPNTYAPESIEEVKQAAKDLKFPLFVKPSMSHIFSQKFRRKGFVANSEKELTKYYLLAAKYNIKVIFQEIIPGLSGKNMYGIEGYFDKKKELRAYFAYCRLRGWPPMFGDTSLRESISVSKISVAFEATKWYLHRLGYQGLMEAEWKRDPRDGVFKLLEINPRQSMQNSLPAKCGLNLVLLAYLDSIGERIDQTIDYKIGVRWTNFLNDLRSAIKTQTSIKDWLLSLRAVQEWSVFAADDPLPLVARTLRVSKDMFLRLMSAC